jgi:hypothetical protein
MKGIVFQLAAQAVAREHGEDAWDDLLDAAGVGGAYTSLGDYPDAELVAIVGAASSALSLSVPDVLRWVGAAIVPGLAQHHADLYAAYPSTRPFVLALNSVIHPEVRKLYPDATPPDFSFDASDPDVLRMTYRSARQMCALAEGLLIGSAAQYSERVDIAHEACMHRGDEACVLALRFSPLD